MKQHLIIVAGGTGTRMQHPVAKQFIRLEGLPLMWWTLRRFREALEADAIITLVLYPGLFDAFRELEDECGPAGIDFLVAGGEERWHSVQNGLATLPDSGVVGIHDAVRPFVSVETIRRCFNDAVAHGSAVPVIPIKDSIRHVHGAASHAMPRAEMRAVQTPQCFDLAAIKEAYASGYQVAFTDDASVYEYAGHTVHLVEGDLENIKITTPEDLEVARTFLKNDRN